MKTLDEYLALPYRMELTPDPDEIREMIFDFPTPFTPLITVIFLPRGILTSLKERNFFKYNSLANSRFTFSIFPSHMF